MSYTTIDNPELYFQCKIYTGNGGTQAITLDGSENLSPNLVWIKDRTDASMHQLHDTVRGTQKSLSSSSNAAEDSLGGSYPGELTAFGSNGFTLVKSSSGRANNSSKNYVAWCFIESATAGFDIVSYTGNATNRTISHSISQPHVMIVKNRDSARDWAVYHHKNTSTPQNDRLLLNTTGATDSSGAEWNDTTPTSSVFTAGTGNSTNESGDAIIAYLFSEKQGFSKFGSYTGNGSADGTFVYTGFKPAWVMMKRTDSAESWHIFDNKRDVDNVIERRVEADSSGAEHTTIDWCDFLSNGIKHRYSGTNVNASGGTFIYMAFAEAPFVNSKGVPNNAR